MNYFYYPKIPWIFLFNCDRIHIDFSDLIPGVFVGKCCGLFLMCFSAPTTYAWIDINYAIHNRRYRTQLHNVCLVSFSLVDILCRSVFVWIV